MKKNLNKFQFSKNKSINSISRFMLSGIFLTSFFYVTPIFINFAEKNSNLNELEQKIVKILDQKIRPAVARDGGDIKFKEFKDGVVKVQLQGSCSGCPSSTMTLKQGVQNLLCHYLPEVKEVIAI